MNMKIINRLWTKQLKKWNQTIMKTQVFKPWDRCEFYVIIYVWKQMIKKEIFYRRFEMS